MINYIYLLKAATKLTEKMCVASSERKLPQTHRQTNKHTHIFESAPKTSSATVASDSKGGGGRDNLSLSTGCSSNSNNVFHERPRN